MGNPASMKRSREADAADATAADDDKPAPAVADPAASSDAAVQPAAPSQGTAADDAVAAPGSPPPPDAASLAAAQFWYYEGQDTVVQGPFSTHDMRAWYAGGYLAMTLPVAPSFYGEVPNTFWTIGTLWSADVVAEQAFASALPPPAPVAAASSAAPAFIDSPRFTGQMANYAFRTDLYGTGYYRDDPQTIEITADDIEKEKAERKAKAKAFQHYTAVTGADFRENKG